jgi:phosphonoacetaldehyde hydrolase
MSFVYQRRYQGPLRAAVLDWAGTVVDYGCRAPAATFIEAFAGYGVPVTVGQARAPMGMAKRAHIQAITRMPEVAEAWQAKYGRGVGEDDIDAIYERFLPLQVAMVEKHADVIPGALEAVGAMRARGLKIGSTTGYPRPVMDVVVRAAAAQGYVPDSIVCAEDTPMGRPGPFPALKALIDMAVYPVEAVVKIGDTVVDIEEGLNGGMWTVGVTVTGNEVGLGLDEWLALDAATQERLREAAAQKLAKAGAHYIVDAVADVLPILDAIEARLARGERP